MEEQSESPMSFRDLLLVAGGGAIGAIARYGASAMCSGLFGDRFPWGTLLVNVVGCFLLGWLLSTSLATISDPLKLALGTGFLGAFTTFSTFGVQTLQAWQRSPLLAIANVGTNLIIGLAAAALGIYIATKQ